MAFIKTDLDKLWDDDVEEQLEELDNRLSRWFWSRSEWAQYGLKRMKLIGLVTKKRKDERLSEN